MGQKKPKSKKEGDEQIARRVKTANNQESLEHAPKMSEYIVRVSKRFVLLTMMSCMLLAFVIGRTARILLLRTPSLIISEGISEKKGGSIGSAVTVTLPDLVLKPGKAVPPTEYTSKTFDTTKSASMKSRWIVTDQGRQQCVNLPGDEVCMAFSDVETLADDTKVTSSINDDVVHLPAGQHLLVDIENVNGTFLNSEEILALAMLELIDECGLTLLSYHCHKMFPLGVSCAGILLESHISFHTWPNEGVITLDLYTCGPKSLLPIIPVVERLFAVPRGGEEDQPNMVWAHKIRGFESSSDDIAEITDMQWFPVGRMTDYKKEIISAETEFQYVDIYDVLRPPFQSLEAYQKSLRRDGSYESLHPELFEPDRIVFLDGVLQSRRSGDAAYHEALVHPSMFAHSNPQRVAIIGGGEGATLREVLKHSTVEKVMMIEIDKGMVDLSRQYLPSWSDCSNIDGGTSSCFDDPRVEIHYMDAFQWFIDTFPVDSPSHECPFDLIIMDALDPQVQKEFVNALYDGGPFLYSLPNALAKNGIFVAQVGAEGTMNDPAEILSLNHNRVKFVQSLVKLGFLAIRDYNDGAYSGFSEPWQIVVAFKDFNTKADWFANPSLVDLKIRRRALPTVDKKSPFKYFDGPTMQTFYYPSKSREIVFCRGNPNLTDCKHGHGFDQERNNLLLSETLEVKPSKLGKNAGRGVFAKVDIPQGSYLGLEKLIPLIYGSSQTYDLMFNWKKRIHWVFSDYWAAILETFLQGYGHIFSYHGKNEFYVDSSFHCFINHACNAKNNVGHKLHISEATADPGVVAEEILEKYTGLEVLYNPAAERQIHFHSSATPICDIKKSEELFDNYLAMRGRSLSLWNYSVLELKAHCLVTVGN